MISSAHNSAVTTHPCRSYFVRLPRTITLAAIAATVERNEGHGTPTTAVQLLILSMQTEGPEIRHPLSNSETRAEAHCDLKTRTAKTAALCEPEASHRAILPRSAGEIGNINRLESRLD